MTCRIGLLALVIAAGNLNAQGAPVSYLIDQDASSLTVSGTMILSPFVVNLEPQFPGSDAAKYQGTIDADLTGNTLTFNGGSEVDAKAWVGSALTPSAAAAGSGSVESNYGVTASFLYTSMQAAIRDFTFDFSSGSATFGGPVTGLYIDFTDGTLDYKETYNPSTSFRDLTSFAPVANQAVGNLGRILVDDLETITIPIKGTLFLQAINPNDTALNVEGNIVASRVIGVPEPPTGLLTIAALGTSWLFLRVQRCRRLPFIIA